MPSAVCPAVQLFALLSIFHMQTRHYSLLGYISASLLCLPDYLLRMLAQMKLHPAHLFRHKTKLFGLKLLVIPMANCAQCTGQPIGQAARASAAWSSPWAAWSASSHVLQAARLAQQRSALMCTVWPIATACPCRLQAACLARQRNALKSTVLPTATACPRVACRPPALPGAMAPKSLPIGMALSPSMTSGRRCGIHRRPRGTWGDCNTHMHTHAHPPDAWGGRNTHMRTHTHTHSHTPDAWGDHNTHMHTHAHTPRMHGTNATHTCTHTHTPQRHMGQTQHTHARALMHTQRMHTGQTEHTRAHTRMHIGQEGARAQRAHKRTHTHARTCTQLTHADTHAQAHGHVRTHTHTHARKAQHVRVCGSTPVQGSAGMWLWEDGT